MSKKMLAAIAVLTLCVVVSVLFIQRPEAEQVSATLQNVRDGKSRIACVDAKWLLDKNFAMIDEKLAQLEEFEKTQGSMNESELNDMRTVTYNEVTPAQKEIEDWYNGVILGIAAFARNDLARQEAIQNMIGEEYVQIYQVAMSVRLNLMVEAEVRQALQENFCN
jgi:hypothetical protein